MPIGRIKFLCLLLSALAAAGAFVAAAWGLNYPGIYHGAVDPAFLPGTLSQDTVTLLVSLLLAGCIAAILLGNRRVWLIWAALVGYLAYGYGIYAFESVMTPLYLLYIAVFGLALWSLFLFARHVRPAVVGPRAGRVPPRRATAVFLLLLALLFAGLWLTILLPASASGAAPPGTTIFVFDYAIMLPLLIVTALALLNAGPLGDLLAAPVLIKTATLGISVLLGTFYAPMFDRPFVFIEALAYAVMGLGPLIPAVLHLRAIEVVKV